MGDEGLSWAGGYPPGQEGGHLGRETLLVGWQSLRLLSSVPWGSPEERRCHISRR